VAVIATFFALIPTATLACNAIHGHVLNAFRFQPIARVPFVINMVIIVLVESALLRMFIRQTGCRHAILNSAVVNAASCVALSLLFLGIGNQFDPFYSWHDSFTFRLLGTFFSGWPDRLVPLMWYLGMALIVEMPLLHVLTRRARVTLVRPLLTALLANTVSYAIVSVSEHYMMRPWYSYLTRQDARLLQEWRKPDVIREATGRIYTLNEEDLAETGTIAGARYAGLTVDGRHMPGGPLGYRLRYFTTADGMWHSVTNSPILLPGFWTLSTNRLAFLEAEQVRIVGFPAMEPRSTVLLKEQALHPIRMLALSPDGRRLAVALVDSGVTRKGGGSATRRFIRNSILVFDTQTGEFLRRCPRWALDASLFWSPDSRNVLFSSTVDAGELDGENIALDRFRESADGRIDYGVDPNLPQGLFSFDVSRGDVKLYSDDAQPVSQSGHCLMWVRHDRLRSSRLEVFDMNTADRQSIPISGLGGWNHLLQLSPSGRFLCAEARLAWNTCHVIVNLQDPRLRYVVSERPLIARPVHPMYFVWLPD
jgi:hypothetical protein